MAILIISSDAANKKTLGVQSPLWGTYAQAHDAAVGSEFPVYVGRLCAESTYAGARYYVQRAFTSWDTSQLDVLQSAPGTPPLTARVAGRYSEKYSVDGHGDLHIVQGIQCLPPIGADYGNHLGQTTSGGFILSSDIKKYTPPFPADPGEMNYIVLNSTGRGWVNTAGITKLCLRLSGDISNLTPTGGNIAYLIWLNMVQAIIGYVTVTNIGKSTATFNGKFYGWTNSRDTSPILELTYVGVNPTYPRLRFSYVNLGTGAVGYTDWQYSTALGQTISLNVAGLSPGSMYSCRLQCELSAGDYEYSNTVFFATLSGTKYLGNILIDQLYFQHVERMRR